MSKKAYYILNRIGISVLTVFLLVTITFLLMHALPGDPFTGTKALPPETVAALNSKYGLDKPLLIQYGIYMSNVLRGDLGISLSTKRPVTEIIAQAFPVSFELGMRSLVFVLVFGVSMGIMAAVKKGSMWDTTAMVTALLGVSVPSFIIGALLQYVLGLKLYELTGLHIFPVLGWAGENSKILPSFTLAFGSIAVVCRLMRSSMLEVLNQNYIETARAKGLPTYKIIVRHCLKNASIPVLTFLGPLVSVVLTGTFVVENIFSIPGLGKYFVTSTQSNDYTVIAGTTLFFGTFLVCSNLMVDLLYAVVDPRIQLEHRKGGRI